MAVALIALLIVGAGLYYWSAARRNAVLAEPRQCYLATLLLVATNALTNRNDELYQATIREIVRLMSHEAWERPEIEWRLRQALLIAGEDVTPEISEKVSRVSQNIARWTVHNSNFLPWETRPFIKLLAQTQRKLAA
jgi:hypothetical protein